MRKHFSFLSTPVNSWQKALLCLLAAAYIAGIVGLQLPLTLPYFQALTPFNLLLSAGIVFAFHTDWNKPFIFFCLITFFTGYFVEVAGVATGIIFGEYSYGPTLGYQALEVPLIIGLNWLMLIYSTGIICAEIRQPFLIKVLLATSLMIVLDLLIEPVAVAFDFWSWQGGHIPVQNYIAWFAVSFFLHLLFFLLPFRKKNPAAKLLYLLQLIFFSILCLFTIY